ncbi:MAG: hypothetical protein K6E18_05685 [Lachnospiraceae bacterium]|nr:hypothetical protein [Lachnospiraceae bacterium]
MNRSEVTEPDMPFKYKDVLDRGKPVHEKDDSFSIKHPPMELSKRAKIFSPFDALKGFGDELARSQTEVTDRFLQDTEPFEDTP